MKRALTLSLLVFGCSGPAPSVPALPESNGDCLASDAGKAMPAPDKTSTSKPLTKGPGLAGLKPGAGVGKRPLRIGQILSMPHAATELQWRALPQTADAELITIVQDDSAEVTTRARAMAGLAIRNTEGAPPSILRVLSGTADETLKRAAVRSLAAAFVEPDGGTVTDALVKTLDDSSKSLREATVKALAPHADKPQIKAALEARSKVETDPLVKEALTAALGA